MAEQKELKIMDHTAALGKDGNAGAKENKHLVKLSRAYKFEDEGEIDSIDLSCLENATAEVLDRKSTRLNSSH